MTRLALTFPGQGSQRPGVGAAWAGTPGWAHVEAASELLGRDLGRLLVEADAEELRRTADAQLATFLLGLVALEAVRPLLTGSSVVGVAGHSLGEYAALVATGALTPAEGTRLVAERGAAMQTAVDAAPGTMAAVLGLLAGDVVAACAAVQGAWVAGENAPAHVLVSGTPAGVAAAGEQARGRGARRVLPLAVGGAFHTPLMAPARERLEAALAIPAWRTPRVPVVANVDAVPHADGWPGLLSQQLTAPVRWRDTVGHLVEDLGAKVLVELGPGGVLTGLARRCATGTTTISIGAPEDVDRLAAVTGARA